MGDKQHGFSHASALSILYHQMLGLPVQTLERLIQDQKVIVSQQTTEIATLRRCPPESSRVG